MLFKFPLSYTQYIWGFQRGITSKEPCLPMQERCKRRWFNLSQEDPLEESMATHSSTAAWRIPQTETSAGLWSMGDKESDVTEAT